MRRPIDIAKESELMSTLVDITGVFEGISSMRISEIKNQVLQSTEFFNSLWGIYTQLRVDREFSFGRDKDSNIINKELFIVITAEGGLSGDIDQKLLQLMLKDYNPERNDIITIGHHGAVQLAQRGISFKKYFKLPVKDKNINVIPIIREVQQYQSTKVYYQEYVSLMIQDVKRIELSLAVKQISSMSDKPDSIISEQSYIFEPSTYAVVAHLERTMMVIAVSQLILESKLAQYASRSRAMSEAHERAIDAKDDLKFVFHRAVRNVKDERSREIFNGLKQVRKVAAV
jgi:ATP synthase F1 gamma subunit